MEPFYEAVIFRLYEGDLGYQWNWGGGVTATPALFDIETWTAAQNV